MTADAEAAPRLAAESPLQSGCDLTSLASTPVDEARFLEARGFFDKLYYLDDNPDVAASDVDPFEHFFLYGYKEGRKPNIAFDTRWYLETYSDVREAGVNCLLHYALLGEREGRRPGALFDVEWYRERHRIDESDSAVLHYLRVRRTGVSPIPHFDAAYYLTTYPDIATAGVDPFEHFMSYGFSEGRNPSPDFDANFYVRRYLGGDYSRNPLLHYLSLADRSGVTTKPRDRIRQFPIWSKGIRSLATTTRNCVPCPGPLRARPRSLPITSRSSTRSPKTTGGGAKASPNGPTSPAACRDSRTITSHAFRATWASTICSIVDVRCAGR